MRQSSNSSTTNRSPISLSFFEVACGYSQEFTNHSDDEIRTQFSHLMVSFNWWNSTQCANFQGQGCFCLFFLVHRYKRSHHMNPFQRTLFLCKHFEMLISTQIVLVLFDFSNLIREFKSNGSGEQWDQAALLCLFLWYNHSLCNGTQTRPPMSIVHHTVQKSLFSSFALETLFGSFKAMHATRNKALSLNPRGPNPSYATAAWVPSKHDTISCTAQYGNVRLFRFWKIDPKSYDSVIIQGEEAWLMHHKQKVCEDEVSNWHEICAIHRLCQSDSVYEMHGPSKMWEIFYISSESSLNCRSAFTRLLGCHWNM